MTAATRYRATAWMDAAACLGCPPEWWELTGEGTTLTVDNRIAMKICDDCPVAAECREARGTEKGVIIAGRRGGTQPKTKPAPTEQAAREQAKPAPVTARPDCTAPSYGSYARHLKAAQTPCAACKAFVAAADREYRERRKEAS